METLHTTSLLVYAWLQTTFALKSIKTCSSPLRTQIAPANNDGIVEDKSALQTIATVVCKRRVFFYYST